MTSALWLFAVILGTSGVTGAPAASGGELGTALQRDGYLLRPPAAFRMGRMDLFEGTRVGAVALEPGSRRFLSAALFDGEGDEASTLLVSVVEEPLKVSPAMREEFSAAVVKHHAEELGAPLALERAELVSGPAPRIEVIGTVSEGGAKRSVLVAGLPGETRHAVVTFSVPTGRFDAMLPVLQESLNSYRVSEAAQGPGGLSRGVWGAVAGALAGALLVSAMLWRAHRRRRELEKAW